MNTEQFMKNLAVHAGKIMNENYEKTFEIETKRDKSFVTEIDKKINDYVVVEIQKKYPEHTILAEEGSPHNKQSEYTWVCDPIDGTTPYIHQIPVSFFSLALLKNGIPIEAVAYHARETKLFYAKKGMGATCNGSPMRVNDEQRLAEGTILYWDCWKQAKYDLSSSYPSLIKKGLNIIQPASIVFNGCQVAQGKGTIAIFPGDKPWDIAAIDLILTEAGGTVTSLYGNKQRYDQEIQGAILSNGLVHEEALILVQEYLPKL